MSILKRVLLCVAASARLGGEAPAGVDNGLVEEVHVPQCCDNPNWTNPDQEDPAAANLGCESQTWTTCLESPNTKEVQVNCPGTCTELIGNFGYLYDEAKQHCYVWCPTAQPEVTTTTPAAESTTGRPSCGWDNGLETVPPPPTRPSGIDNGLVEASRPTSTTTTTTTTTTATQLITTTTTTTIDDGAHLGRCKVGGKCDVPNHDCVFVNEHGVAKMVYDTTGRCLARESNTNRPCYDGIYCAFHMFCSPDIEHCQIRGQKTGYPCTSARTCKQGQCQSEGEIADVDMALCF